MWAGEVPQDEIEGHIILVGTSAPGLLDLRATPVDAAVPGIDIHAQSLEHLLKGTYLQRPDYALALEEFLIVVLGIMLAIVLPRVSALASGAIGALTVGLVLVGGWGVFRYANVFLDPSYPALVMGIMTAGITFTPTIRRKRSVPRSAAPSANILLPLSSSSWRNRPTNSCSVAKSAR